MEMYHLLVSLVSAIRSMHFLTDMLSPGTLYLQTCGLIIHRIDKYVCKKYMYIDESTITASIKASSTITSVIHLLHRFRLSFLLQKYIVSNKSPCWKGSLGIKPVGVHSLGYLAIQMQSGRRQKPFASWLCVNLTWTLMNGYRLGQLIAWVAKGTGRLDGCRAYIKCQKWCEKSHEKVCGISSLTFLLYLFHTRHIDENKEDRWKSEHKEILKWTILLKIINFGVHVTCFVLKVAIV